MGKQSFTTSYVITTTKEENILVQQHVETDEKNIHVQIKMKYYKRQ